MSGLTVTLLALGLLAGTTATQISYDGWNLVFEDEFEGEQLDTRRWTVADKYRHCCPLEPQLYVTDEVYLENGNLVLRTRKRTVPDKQGNPVNYTSGWVDSKEKMFFKFGRWVIRAKLPDTHMTGVWPAHWLMPNPSTSDPPDICWPVGGEIDIMEQIGLPIVTTVWGSFRWSRKCGKINWSWLPGGPYPSVFGPQIDFSADYHEFGVDWSPTELQYHVDGHVFHVEKIDKVPIPQNAFYTILNTAIYPSVHKLGQWFGADEHLPVYHYIDWVRVYQQQS